MGNPNLNSVQENYDENHNSNQTLETEALTEETTGITAVHANENLFAAPKSKANKLSMIAVVLAAVLGGGSLAFQLFLFKTNAAEMEAKIATAVKAGIADEAKKSKVQKQISDALAAQEKTMQESLAGVKTEISGNVARDIDALKSRLDNLERAAAARAAAPAKKAGGAKKRK